MSDDLIIKLIWGVMELEQKFEDDPYSLTLEEIKVLSDNEKHKIQQNLVSSKKHPKKTKLYSKVNQPVSGCYAAFKIKKPKIIRCQNYM